MAVGKGDFPTLPLSPAHTDHLEVEASCLAPALGQQSTSQD